MKNLIAICFLLFHLQDGCGTKVETQTLATSTDPEYEACCGSKPVEFTLGSSYVYVPNVFTPNGDNVNDLFMPFVNDGVGEVQEFTILSAVGDTVIFRRPTFDYTRINQYAWNGKRKDGSLYKGLFKYGMRIVTKDLQFRVVEGEACLVRCGTGTAIFKTKSGCYYPVQAKSNGVLDASLSTQESSCFN